MCIFMGKSSGVLYGKKQASHAYWQKQILKEKAEAFWRLAGEDQLDAASREQWSTDADIARIIVKYVPQIVLDSVDPEEESDTINTAKADLYQRVAKQIEKRNHKSKPPKKHDDRSVKPILRALPQALQYERVDFNSENIFV